MSGIKLAVGDHVEGWYCGERYTAVVKAIHPHQRGDGDFLRVILVRDDNHAEVSSYSDAVRVIP